MNKNHKKTTEGLFTNNGIHSIQWEYDELAFRWKSLIFFGSFWLGSKEIEPKIRPRWDKAGKGI